MATFRFGIMGTGGIAHKFADAVKLIDQCEITAVANRTMVKAQQFADKYAVDHVYDDFEEMLKQESLDAVYIATTMDVHYRLTQLCLKYQVPVLCEKAMFMTSEEAITTLNQAHDKKVFVMEAMWSKFLPTYRQVLDWLTEGKIGEITTSDYQFGNLVTNDPQNRFFNPELGGGVSFDLTVYTYDLTTMLLGHEFNQIDVATDWRYNVDVTDHVVLHYDHSLATMTTSFVAALGNQLVIYGDAGKIVIPNANDCKEAFLYDGNNQLVEHYQDEATQNGFTYEIKEVINCVYQNKLESPIVPHQLTIASARLYDQIWEQKKKSE